MFKIEGADQKVLDLLRDPKRFDYYRLVDVKSHQVYDYQKGRLLKQESLCYDIWKRNRGCQNCSSGAAVRENREMIKLEYLDEEVYLIESCPISVEGSVLSLEMIRVVTGCLRVADPLHRDNSDITGLVRELNEAAILDHYTKLYNKKYTEQELGNLVEQNKTKPEPLAVSLMDIDHFKNINDTYGHRAGDEVISQIVRYIKEGLKIKNAWASRIGGDEFLMVFPGLKLENARQISSGLQEKISAHAFSKGSDRFSVTVSCGVAEYRGEMESWKMLFEEADQQMYLEKRKKMGA